VLAPHLQQEPWVRESERRNRNRKEYQDLQKMPEYVAAHAVIIIMACLTSTYPCEHLSCRREESCTCKRWVRSKGSTKLMPTQSKLYCLQTEIRSKNNMPSLGREEHPSPSCKHTRLLFALWHLHSHFESFPFFTVPFESYWLYGASDRYQERGSLADR
jgi:hypothetical protein